MTHVLGIPQERIIPPWKEDEGVGVEVYLSWTWEDKLSQSKQGLGKGIHTEELPT